MRESIVQFFAEYQAARSVCNREQIRIGAGLFRSFHTSEHVAKEAEEWLCAREKESITNIVEHGHRAEVMTTGDVNQPKRYLLVRDKEQWLIEQVQLRCGACGGAGELSTRQCQYCSGAGWRQSCGDS